MAVSKLKIAIVVQRYGNEINGGAEFHARLVAEELAQYYQVEVMTTCALDYITWANHYKTGTEDVNGIPVHRFPVKHPRSPEKFGKIQEQIFGKEHDIKQEMKWLQEEGPYSPKLIKAVKKQQNKYDYFIFFSFRYYHSYHGITAIPHKSILVPTAEEDPTVELMIFNKFFSMPRAIMYNSFEEMWMINDVSRNNAVPHVVVGVGTELPPEADMQPQRFRKKFGIKEPFILYIGRIDENKGSHVLFDYFQKYKADYPSDLKLVLMGKNIIPIPDHEDIISLGFVSNEEKFDGIAACDLLINPSLFESLSMIILEAWAAGKPVLVNGDVPVLKGQSKRSNGGLWYHNADEFEEALNLLRTDDHLRDAMGESGKKYFHDNYTWEVINQKYIDIIETLYKEDEVQ